MIIVAIIPVRYDSTRFPGKPLAKIGDKPMIQHVYENASKVHGLDRVLVATDDRRILETVKGFGGEAMLTSKRHATGTDRLAEVVKKIKADWVVNVQGDLPFVRPQTISKALRSICRSRSIPMVTVRTPIYQEQEWFNPNVVKVVTDSKGFALYFSRAPLPYIQGLKKPALRPAQIRRSRIWGYRHVGIYVYRRDFLSKFSRLPASPLERTEHLEQLRALERGYSIRVMDVNEPSVEVDTPEDLQKAEDYLKNVRLRR